MINPIEKSCQNLKPSGKGSALFSKEKATRPAWLRQERPWWLSDGHTVGLSQSGLSTFAPSWSAQMVRLTVSVNLWLVLYSQGKNCQVKLPSWFWRKLLGPDGNRPTKQYLLSLSYTQDPQAGPARCVKLRKRSELSKTRACTGRNRIEDPHPHWGKDLITITIIRKQENFIVPKTVLNSWRKMVPDSIHSQLRFCMLPQFTFILSKWAHIVLLTHYEPTTFHVKQKRKRETFHSGGSEVMKVIRARIQRKLLLSLFYCKAIPSQNDLDAYTKKNSRSDTVFL